MYKVFYITVGWSDVLFIIDNNLTYKELLNNVQTSILKKKDYVGTFSFDDNFLKIFDYKILNNYKYYYRNLYERDIKKQFSQDLF